jgi:hypothetical protein
VQTQQRRQQGLRVLCTSRLLLLLVLLLDAHLMVGMTMSSWSASAMAASSC